MNSDKTAVEAMIAKLYRESCDNPDADEIKIIDALASQQATIEELREEIEIWKSVFPDIAPRDLLSERSTTEFDLRTQLAAVTAQRDHLAESEARYAALLAKDELHKEIATLKAERDEARAALATEQKAHRETAQNLQSLVHAPATLADVRLAKAVSEEREAIMHYLWGAPPDYRPNGPTENALYRAFHWVRNRSATPKPEQESSGARHASEPHPQHLTEDDAP